MRIIKIIIVLVILVPGFGFSQNDLDTNKCTWDNSYPLHSLDKITCRNDFDVLQKTTFKLNQTLQSIKVSYNLRTKHMYFINTSNYETHFDFCKQNLNYKKTQSEFNHFEYTVNKFREYSNFTISYLPNLDIYIFEYYFSTKELTSNLLIEAYELLCKNVYFKDKLRFLVVDNSVSSLPIPYVDASEIYEDKFECFNAGKTYGYLNIINNPEELISITEKSIVVLKHPTNYLPIAAGVISEIYQTPLSHINVLSKNRGTPNMRLPSASKHFRLKGLEKQLLYFEVTTEGFTLKPAKIEEAMSFWSKRVNAPINLEFDTVSNGIIPVSKLNFADSRIVGTKAANFSEIKNIKPLNVDSIYTPENAFAIPFYYYQKHISQNGIDKYINVLLDTLNNGDSIKVNKVIQCSLIRNKIINAPINPELLILVEQYIQQQNSNDVAFRFRSSSNAEDLVNFNGAGLYDSKTGILNHKSKTIEKAIKSVWASLWNYRAFEERTYFGLNQQTVFMGILVHRAFPSEDANGVAVTADVFNTSHDGCYINVQVDEASIVRPDSAVECDEILVQFQKTKHKITYLNQSSLLENGEKVLTENEIELLTNTLIDIKEHFYRIFNSNKNYNEFALEVEFKFDKAQRKLYIKQVRSYPY